MGQYIIYFGHCYTNTSSSRTMTGQLVIGNKNASVCYFSVLTFIVEIFTVKHLCEVNSATS